MQFLNLHYLDHTAKNVEEDITHYMIYLSMLLNMENHEKSK